MNDVSGSPPQLDLVGQLAERLFTLTTELQIRLLESLKQLDITESMAAAIWWLGHDETPMSRRELAACLHFDPSNVTLIADRLEARGLVERAVDERDRRYKAMRLTDAGHALRASLVEATTSAAMFRQLSPADLNLLNDLLGRALDTERNWKVEKSRLVLSAAPTSR
jgi:DNA-binding MarR family transcriptional regulator